MTIYYMNPHTGTVQTEADWRADYESMTSEAWYGNDTSEKDDATWLDGLIEVVRDKNGNWIEA